MIQLLVNLIVGWFGLWAVLLVTIFLITYAKPLFLILNTIILWVSINSFVPLALYIHITKPDAQFTRTALRTCFFLMLYSGVISFIIEWLTEKKKPINGDKKTDVNITTPEH